MSRIFVEYAVSRDDVGYTDRPLNVIVRKRAPLQFEPKEEYDGRRVEEFDTELEAEQLVRSKPKIFKIACEIMDIETQDKIGRIVDLRLKQIFVRLEALEGKGAEAPVTPKRRTRAKKVE